MALSQQQMDSVKSRVVFEFLPNQLRATMSLPGVVRNYVENDIPIEEWNLLLFPETGTQFEYYGQTFNFRIIDVSVTGDISPLEPISSIKQNAERLFTQLDQWEQVTTETEHLSIFKRLLGYKPKQTKRVKRFIFHTSLKEMLDE